MRTASCALSALAAAALAGSAGGMPDGCGEFDSTAMDGLMRARVGNSDVSDGEFFTCEYFINPAQLLTVIKFNTTAHALVGEDHVDIYDNLQTYRQGGSYIRRFTGEIPGRMQLSGSDTAFILFAARSNASYFEMQYTCVKMGDREFSVKLSPLWLTLWLVVVVLIVCLCCGVSLWLLRHRRRSHRDRVAAHQTMLVLHSELMRRRAEARRVVVQAVEARESRTVEMLERMPTQPWHDAQSERSIEGGDEECCLCMEKFADADELRVLPCDHFFHKECVDRWFAARRFQPRTCPLCKQDPLRLSGADPDAELDVDGTSTSTRGAMSGLPGSMAAASLGGLFMSALALAAELGEPVTRAEVDAELSAREEGEAPPSPRSRPEVGPSNSPSSEVLSEVVVTSVSSEDGGSPCPSPPRGSPSRAGGGGAQ